MENSTVNYFKLMYPSRTLTNVLSEQFIIFIANSGFLGGKRDACLTVDSHDYVSSLLYIIQCKATLRADYYANMPIHDAKSLE